jgi:hypothetical protein
VARITRAITLRHQSNLSEGVEAIAFEAGAEVTILEEWERHYLCKSQAGQLFNVPKEYVER